VLNFIPLGVFWKDRDSRYLGCNDVVLRTLGLSSARELIGKTDADVPTIPPKQATFFVEKDRAVMQADAPERQVIEPLTRADGTTIWLESSKIPMHDEQGRVIGVLGTWQDITERRRFEHAIAGYSQRLRILHEIDRALIAGESPAAIAAGALPPLRDLLGARRVVVNLFDLVAGEVEWLAATGPHRVRVGPGVRYSMQFMGDVAALRRGEQQIIDVRRLPPGPEVDALLGSGVHTYAVVPMIAHGELIGALSFGGTPAPFSTEQLGIVHEVAAQFAIAITHARLHECVQRQAQDLEVRVLERTAELEAAQDNLRGINAELVALTSELQAANKELDAFSYSVSHDLRAPLRAIDGFARILLEDFAAQLPADAQAYLHDVRANTQHMGRLVDDLLAFSRLIRQPIKKQATDSAALVRQCLEELRAARQGRVVDIRVGELPNCQADPSLLKQVWLNLLGNALKYTSKRAAALIDIGCRRADGVDVFYVKDNGVGFDMRYASKLFGVFQRLHRAEDYEGTGVGLAIVQRIIGRHGGQVWAEAQPNQGAVFSFTLDSNNPGAALAPGRAAAKQCLGGLAHAE
jgi:PAS domain S-box-containing protein